MSCCCSLFSQWMISAGLSFAYRATNQRFTSHRFHLNWRRAAAFDNACSCRCHWVTQKVLLQPLDAFVWMIMLLHQDTAVLLWFILQARFVSVYALRAFRLESERTDWPFVRHKDALHCAFIWIKYRRSPLLIMQLRIFLHPFSLSAFLLRQCDVWVQPLGKGKSKK